MKRTMVALMLALVMVLVAVCGAVAETVTDLEQLIAGTWELSEIKGVPGSDDNEVASSLEMIKSIGGSITLTFQDGMVTVSMQALGQAETTESEYQIDGDRLVIEGTELQCIIEEDTMTLTDGTTSMVLIRAADVESTTGTTVSPVSGSSLNGTWKLTAATGDGESAEAYQMILSYGGEVTMAFDNGACTVTASLMGQSQSDTFSYEDTGSEIVMNGAASSYTIENDVLTISEEGLSITLVRK